LSARRSSGREAHDAPARSVAGPFAGSVIETLRIQIVLPFRTMTGGNLVLLELANRLAARGHRVWMLFQHEDVPWWKARGFTRLALRDHG
jgi:hypothetical protein